MEAYVELLDGGMGTLLQAKGLRSGETPEDWNVDHSDAVTAVHRAYVRAGSRIVYANTFGANPLKYRGKYTLEEVVRAGVRNACKVKEEGFAVTACPLVALDVGPTGKLLKPLGDLGFDEAVSAFAETIRIGAAAGADLVAVETMSDLRELKAAVVAAKETCDLPVYATVSLGEDGRLLTGASVESVSALLESLDVVAYGLNCGLGPDRMLPAVKQLKRIATKPIVAKPNAGLPRVVDGKTVFTVDAVEFAEGVRNLVKAGASIVGGCCGTTPEHIREVANGGLRIVKEERPVLPDSSLVFCRSTTVSSGTTAVELKPHEGLIIGERINPTGKKALKAALARGDTAYVLREAVRQVEAGAKILDVNCGVPGLNETALLASTVEAVQGVVTCPVQVDTADPLALEQALRRANGKPLVNSVNGKRSSMEAVFPLVKKYGGTMVALCLDESGIPPTSDGRIAIARRILSEGEKYGFGKADFVFDALTLSVSADSQAAAVTLETVRRLTEEVGVNTVLGVSNVSFGLPNRPALNNAMYALAKRAGLSAAIANPSLIRDEVESAAEDVLLGRDVNCEKWIRLQSADAALRQEASSERARTHCLGDPERSSDALISYIRRGLKEDAGAASREMLAAGRSAMDIIQEGIVPALEEVGCGFEKGTVFLPQLLMAADAAGEAFGAVRQTLPSHACRASRKSGPIVLATVRGDIHDIGKNIVRALLENYGFDVIDLGRDVSPERILETARKTGAKMVGLSALMTTTVGAMAETVRLLRTSGLSCRTCVGGAVVTQEYADSIGADFYAKDAMRTVRFAESLAAE